NPVRLGEILGDHWSVESHEPCGIGEPGEQRGDVAVANEHFRMSGNLAQIEDLEEVIRSVSAAGANDRADIVPLEHLLQLASAAFDRSREIEVVREDRLVENGVITQASQSCAA